jgi:hypothetical protein
MLLKLNQKFTSYADFKVSLLSEIEECLRDNYERKKKIIDLNLNCVMQGTLFYSYFHLGQILV